MRNFAVAELVRDGAPPGPRSAGRLPDPPGGTDFRPDIEGLRAVAVLLVVLAHAGVPLVGGGYIGVDVFFVISGFLITSLLLREAGQTGRISVPRFYARRAVRLLPAAALVLITTLVAARLFLPGVRLGEYARDALAAAGYVANLRFADAGTDYLRADQSPSPFQHFWSLAVEEQFYLVWPLLVLALAVRRRLLAAVLAMAVTGSFVLSITETARSAPWAYFGPHTRAWELGAGALLALAAPRLPTLVRPTIVRSALARSALVRPALVRPALARPALVRPALVRPALGWAGLAAILVSALRYDHATAYPGWRAALPVAGAVALIAARGAGVGRLLACRPLQTVGRLSYGWYLWHWPALLVGPAALGIAGTTAQKLALSAGALLLAAASYRWVEGPLRHRAVLRIRARRGLGLGAALTAAVAGVAALLILLPPAVPTGEQHADLRTVLAAADDPAAVLATAVAAAPHKLPANLTPTLARAARDRPRVWADGCHADVPVTTAPQGCVYGDPTAATTVVLFGDSHAAHWFPALERLAAKHRWRLVELTKSACSAVDVPLRHQTLKREYTECTAFRRSALTRIERLRPSLVVVGSSFNYEPARPAADPAAQWSAGWARTFDRLHATGARVVAIADTPYMGGPVPECLSTERTVTGCTRTLRSSLRGPAQRRAFLAYAGSPRTAIIDPIGWFCTDVCPPVIGNLLVYRDSNHMTTTYSAALAPLLGAALSAGPGVPDTSPAAPG